MSDAPSHLIDAIMRRRSVAPRRLAGPGPTDAQAQVLAEAAAAAPDHGRLRPWRLVMIAPEARDALAAAFRAAAREADPEAAPETLDREADRARSGPCLFALVARIVDDHPLVPAHEQWIAVGAALQNMLLAAEAMGYRGMIVSGRKTQSRALREALALAERETLVGFVALGAGTAPPRPAERPDHSEIMTVWTGSARR
jgi:nitroreductase